MPLSLKYDSMLRVKSLSDFRKRSIRQIRIAVRDQSLDMDQIINTARHESTIFPVGGNTSIRVKDQYIFPLAKDSAGRLYYSGFSALFKLDLTEYVFQSLSLRVWAGEIIDDLRILFRAEWEPYGISSASNAQPHWQLDELILSDDSPFIHISKKFHFAMASTWASNEVCQNHVESISSLTTWMKNCLSYTRSQIQHLG